MGFEQFGHVSYVSQTKISEFAEHLKNGLLMGTKCKKCGAIYFPPRADCTECLTDEIEWVKVNGDATLVTFTQVNFAPTAFQDDVPYILALGKLTEGQQVFARIGKKVPMEQIKIGMKLQLVPINLGDNRVSYEFKLPSSS